MILPTDATDSGIGGMMMGVEFACMAAVAGSGLLCLLPVVDWFVLRVDCVAPRRHLFRQSTMTNKMTHATMTVPIDTRMAGNKMRIIKDVVVKLLLLLMLDDEP